MKQLLIILFYGITICSFSQNVLIMNGVFARPGDTVIASVNINNVDKFISFQFDLPLPGQVSFLGYSIHMSERSTNHVAIGNMVGSNLLRIFSYSPNNSEFQGNNGEVVSFKLIIGNIRGEFPLNPQNCIIGDSLSKNIITGVENGILSVFPLAIEDGTIDSKKILQVFPNPAKENVIIHYQIDHVADIRLSIFDSHGNMVKHIDEKSKQSGNYKIKWETSFVASGTYYCRLSGITKQGKKLNSEAKIIVIK